MKKSTSLLLLPFLFSSAGAQADGVKRIVQDIDAGHFESLSLEMSVGELAIEVYDGDEIQLDIQLQGRRSLLSWRRTDVDDIDLEQRASGDHLHIGIDEKNIEQTWVVRLPARLALEIDVGVGDIRIEDLANSLELELGVGAIKVEVAGDTDFDSIHASAGVGDAVIRGFSRGADNERSFVSADAYYHGDGAFDMEIEVGVGDVTVRRY